MFKTGDIVKIINGDSGYEIPLGQVCKVLDANTLGVWLDPFRGDSPWTRLKYNRLFFSNEFVEITREFKVGDKIRVISDGRWSGHRAEIGDYDVIERVEDGVHGQKWAYCFHEVELVTEEKKMVDWDKPIEWVSDEDVYPAKVVGTDIFDHKIVLADTKHGQLFNSFTDAGELTDDFGYVDADGCDVIRNKKRWANLYVKPAGSAYDVVGFVHESREMADQQTARERLACVEIL